MIGCRIAAAIVSVALQMGAGWLGGLLYPCRRSCVWICACAAVWLGMTCSAEIWRKDNCRSLKREESRVWLIWIGMLTDVLFLGAIIGAVVRNVYVVMAIDGAAGILLTDPLVFFLFCRPSTSQPHSRKNELKKRGFPQLHALLREEKERIGHRRRLRIFLGDGGVSAFVKRSYDGIMISPLFLSVLTKRELKQVLRHELIHLTDAEVRREFRWRRLDARAKYVRELAGFRLPAMKPVLMCTERFGEHLTDYLRRVELSREREADACTDAQARYAVAAMAKAEFVDRFLAENGNLPRSMEKICAAYDSAIIGNGKRWLAELERAPKEMDDPHPCFRDRRQYLGVMNPDPFEKEQDAGWLCEIRRMWAITDKIMNPRR